MAVFRLEPRSHGKDPKNWTQTCTSLKSFQRNLSMISNASSMNWSHCNFVDQSHPRFLFACYIRCLGVTGWHQQQLGTMALSMWTGPWNNSDGISKIEPILLQLSFSWASPKAPIVEIFTNLPVSQIFRFHQSAGPAKFLAWLPESCSRANLRRLEPTSTSFSLQSAVTSCAFHDRDAQRPKAETTYRSFYRGHRSASTAAFTLEGLFQRLTKLRKMIPKFPDLKKGGSTVLKAFWTSHFDRYLCVVALPISPHGIRHVRWCIRNGFLPSLSRHKGAKGH